MQAMHERSSRQRARPPGFGLARREGEMVGKRKKYGELSTTRAAYIWSEGGAEGVGGRSAAGGLAAARQDQFARGGRRERQRAAQVQSGAA